MSDNIELKHRVKDLAIFDGTRYSTDKCGVNIAVERRGSSAYVSLPCGSQVLEAEDAKELAYFFNRLAKKLSKA